MNHNSTFRLILISIGIAVSLLVMVGWLIESRIIVQIHPEYHPMQFNTALGFLLINAGFYALHTGRARLCIVFASSLMLLYTLTLLEHLFGLQMGIDTLFVEPFVTQPYAPPGRPGANTSVCFWLLGIGVWVFNHKLRQPGLWIGSIASIVLGMSLASLWGYAEGLHELTGWAPYLSGMSVHTAVLFLLCAMVLFSLLLTRSAQDGRWFHAFRPVHASIPLMIMSLTVWNAMRQWDRARIQRELFEDTRSIASSIVSGFESRRNAFLRLSHRWESEPGFTPESWLADSRNYIEYMPALVMLRLQADNQLLQRIGSTLNTGLADRIVQKHEPVGAPGTSRVLLIDDRAFLVVNLELERDGDPIGELACVMDLVVWLSGYAAELSDGLEMELRHDGQAVFVWDTDQALDQRLSASVPLILPGQERPFVLRLEATRAYIDRARSPWSLAILIGGVVGSLVLWLILKQSLLLARSRHEIAVQSIELTTKSSQLTRANAELTEVNREMEHLNRAISHDLHSPLFSIKNYLSLMHTASRDGDRARSDQYIGRVSQICDRMSVTIDSLLTVCAISGDGSRHVRVHLNPLIEDVLGYIEGDIDDANAQIEVDEHLHDVVGDPVLLGNIVQNLVSNATKHARLPDRPLRIHIGTEPMGDMVCLYVEDNGVGISAEHREIIFEVFQRVEGHGTAGTGIGLSIVSRGIRIHRGKAWVEDSPMGGARFCVTIPRAEG